MKVKDQGHYLYKVKHQRLWQDKVMDHRALFHKIKGQGQGQEWHNVQRSEVMDT